MEFEIQSSNSDVTLLLLTKDRSRFLKRWVEFYFYADIGYPTIIADGSTNNSKEDFLNADIFNKKLSYLYIGPDINLTAYMEKSIQALNLVKTKYTIMLSDDDFFSSSAINIGSKFLDNNPEFVLSYNLAIDFGLSIRPSEENSHGGKIRYIRRMPELKAIKGDIPHSRILEYLDYFPSYWHSVVRTESLLAAWKEAKLLNFSRADTLELFLNIYLLMEGKFNSGAEQIILFHQVHGNMLAQSLESSINRIKNPSWIKEIGIIENYLTKKYYLGINSEFRIMFRKAFLENSGISGKIKKNRSYIVTRYFKAFSFKYRQLTNYEPKLTNLALIPESSRIEFANIQNFLLKYR